MRRIFAEFPSPRLAAMAALGGLLIHGGAAHAHDFWIEPSDFRPEPGQGVYLTLRVGEDFSGTSQPLIPDWFTDYSVRGPEGPDLVGGMIGDDPAGRFIPGTDGLYQVGYRSSVAFVAIDPPTFLGYLEKEGLDRAIARRAERGESDQPARELFSRCAKTLLRVGDGGDGTGHDTRFGYTLELVPERNPYALAVGDPLPMRLLYEGAPIADLLIIAFTAEAPAERQALRTDADGRATLTLDRAGTWLVKAVHIIELPADDERAEWESFWASLTFELAP